MTPAIVDGHELIAAAVILALFALLLFWLTAEITARRRAQRRAMRAAETARIATERAGVLTDRLRAAGIETVDQLDAAIRSYAAARREAGI